MLKNKKGNSGICSRKLSEINQSQKRQIYDPLIWGA